MKSFKLPQFFNRLLHRPTPAVALLALLAPAGGTVGRQPDSLRTTESMSAGLCLSMLRHKQQPFKQSPLSQYSLKTSLLMGLPEKVVNKVKDTGGISLGYHLTYSDPPSDIPKNPFVHMTKVRQPSGKSYEEMLLDKITASKGNLTPGDVLSMSLDVTKGDYYLASLTAHNLLKEAAYTGAGTSASAGVYGWDRGKQPNSKSSRIATPDVILDKLINLRSPGDKFEADKDGPWYHMFGVLFVGGAISPGTAGTMAEVENLTRALRLGSSPDAFKELTNTRSAAIGSVLSGLTNGSLYLPEDISKLSDAEIATLRKQIQDAYAAGRKDLEGTTASQAELANARRGLLRALSDEAKRIDKELTKRRDKAAEKKKPKTGYWELEKIIVIPIENAPAKNGRFSRIDPSGGAGTLTVKASWNDMQLKVHSSTALLNWTISPDPQLLVPGSKLKITGALSASGEMERTNAGIIWHPPGYPAHVGHASGIVIKGLDGSKSAGPTSFDVEATVPEGSRFPNGLALRFIAYASGYGGVEYIYKWVGPRVTR